MSRAELFTLTLALLVLNLAARTMGDVHIVLSASVSLLCGPILLADAFLSYRLTRRVSRRR